MSKQLEAETKLFHGDVVTKIADPTYRGKVVRSWTDEDAPPDPYLPIDKHLNRGEVLICNAMSSEFESAPQASLQLFDRQFMKGDLVKHALTDVESAVVISVETECQLEHVISHERIPRWIPWKQLTNAVKIEAKDKVVYDEWIGTVEEVFEDGLIEAMDGSCYRIAEMGGLLETGRYANEVLPEHPEFLSQFSQFPSFANPMVDRVISVRPLILFIVWNAINQTLPVAEHDKHPQPKTFWSGAEIEQLTHFELMKQQAPPLGTTVVFRDQKEETAAGAKATGHMNGTFMLRVYRVIENRSRLKVRWQDGTETEEFSAGFVPYRNVDDYESWPGEHIMWRNDAGERRPAVVQTYNPKQRIAELLMLDTKEKETVSALELDTGGFGKINYGVGVGQIVLFCENNGAPTPEVPTLGQVDPPEDGREGFRKELNRMAYVGPGAEALGSSLPKGDRTKITWWGEVVDLHLDGSVDVELYNGERRSVDIKHLIILNEAEGPFPGEEFDELMSEKSWETMSQDGSDWDAGAGENGDDRQKEPHDEHQDERQGDFDDLLDTYYADVDMVHSVHMDDDAMSAEDAEAVESQTRGSPRTPAKPLTSLPDSPAQSNAVAAEAGPSNLSSRPSLADDSKWVRFEVLEEAPAEHYYYPESRLQAPSKTYLSRIMKEHRALTTSLPENILVRTYEDRTDLMRVLIIGPEGTPYADAPFVFDVYLNPSKFPFEPPLVHFHSHTNGLGRCNPNLYEEGKVCLSILGTWAGDKSESWNPQKSSLLQVFVSISGLVLVRSPYHCEPAYAKLEGTREGRVNSRLYSEKAYVLSRSFVRTALERPPVGLENEIRYYYLEKGRLASVIAHAQRLIAKGEAAAAEGKEEAEDDENEDKWNADAMGSLTMGAILTLKRTIASLEKIRVRESA